MPTDLEQQLAGFAEALDRDAPMISFDDVVGRGTIAVDVDLLDHPTADRASDDNDVAWRDTTLGDDNISEDDGLIELAPAPVVRRPTWRRVSLKVALAAAAIAVLVVSLATIERGGDEVDRADVPDLTTTFVSPRNGFSVRHPEDATVIPATGDGEDGFDVVDTGLGAVFEGASSEVYGVVEGITGPSDADIDRDMSDAGVWPGGCGVARRQQAEITIDGQLGRIAECPNRIEATVVAGGKLYLFILSHERSDARAVFDAFVATVDLTPETTAHLPAMTTPFDSPTNGFSYRYLDRGGLEPATEIWDPIDQQPDADPWSGFDYFDTGFGAAFAGASTAIPEGVSIDAWVDEYVTSRAAEGCGVPRSAQAETTIDGQSGRTAECSRRVEATVVAGGRLYLFTMWHDRTDGRAWFDAWVTTIDLTPETATAP